jgi:hypothetical protein
MWTEISRPLGYICDKSISTGIFPDCLKYAIAKPVYKKGNTASMMNYRHISLLTAVSKVFETAMYRRLNHHLQVHNIWYLSNMDLGSVCQLTMRLLN